MSSSPIIKNIIYIYLYLLVLKGLAPSFLHSLFSNPFLPPFNTMVKKIGSKERFVHHYFWSSLVVLRVFIPYLCDRCFPLLIISTSLYFSPASLFLSLSLCLHSSSCMLKPDFCDWSLKTETTRR